MGGTGGFLSAWGKSADDASARERDEAELGKRKVRDLKADELQTAITSIQNDTSLSPKEKEFKLGEAHKQLTGLYEPHEGPDLLKRLKNLHHKPESPNKSATAETGDTKVGDATIPSEKRGVQLRPGITLDEILASPSASETAKAGTHIGSPFQGADSKWYIMEESTDGKISKKELPGYTQESELQKYIDSGFSKEDAQKALRIKHGIEPKAATTHKGFKYDKDTDEVVNVDTGDRYARGAVDAEDTPAVVGQMFKGADAVTGQKEKVALRRFSERVKMQATAIAAAFDKGDYTQARRALNKSKDDLTAAKARQRTMHENEQGALNGNQQAALSLVAQHIGMTLGAQKGARITRAVWEEAMDSAPWLEIKIAKAFHQDPQTGDYVFDGWKEGVTLTQDQIKQMVELGDQRVGVLQKSIEDVQDQYKDDLNKSHGTKPKPQADSDDEAIIKALGGGK